MHSRRKLIRRAQGRRRSLPAAGVPASRSRARVAEEQRKLASLSGVVRTRGETPVIGLLGLVIAGVGAVPGFAIVGVELRVEEAGFGVGPDDAVGGTGGSGRIFVGEPPDRPQF